jgi:hypothetical protein
LCCSNQMPSGSSQWTGTTCSSPEEKSPHAIRVFSSFRFSVLVQQCCLNVNLQWQTKDRGAKCYVHNRDIDFVEYSYFKRESWCRLWVQLNVSASFLLDLWGGRSMFPRKPHYAALYRRI